MGPPKYVSFVFMTIQAPNVELSSLWLPSANIPWTLWSCQTA